MNFGHLEGVPQPYLGHLLNGIHPPRTTYPTQDSKSPFFGIILPILLGNREVFPTKKPFESVTICWHPGAQACQSWMLRSRLIDGSVEVVWLEQKGRNMFFVDTFWKGGCSEALSSVFLSCFCSLFLLGKYIDEAKLRSESLSIGLEWPTSYNTFSVGCWGLPWIQ